MSRSDPHPLSPGPEQVGPAPTENSPIPSFLRAFRAGRWEALQPFLHEEIVYQVEGFEQIVGRRAVLAYWRRMFEVHETVRVSLARHVRDGDVVIAAQRQLFLARRRPPLMLDSLAVYELEDERIRLWSERLDDEIAEQDAAVWHRLRTARW